MDIVDISHGRDSAVDSVVDDPIHLGGHGVSGEDLEGTGRSSCHTATSSASRPGAMPQGGAVLTARASAPRDPCQLEYNTIPGGNQIPTLWSVPGAVSLSESSLTAHGGAP